MAAAAASAAFLQSILPAGQESSHGLQSVRMSSSSVISIMGRCGALKNKPIVERSEHMACPPTASRQGKIKKNKEKKKMDCIQISNWSQSVDGAMCVCVMSKDARGRGRRRTGTLHSINK